MTEIVVRPDEHVFIGGATGSGKSTLARALFYGYSRLVVIDPKHEELVPRALVTYTPAEFRQAWPQRAPRVVFRPDPEDPKHRDVDEVIRRVLAHRRCRIVLHETADYAQPGWIVPALRRALMTGRSLEVGVGACSQRPIGLHNVVLSEASHLFVFRLALEGDREKLAGVIGPAALEQPASAYGFLYGGPAMGGRVVACPPLPVPAPTSPVDPAQTGGGAAWSGRRSATSPS